MKGYKVFNPDFTAKQNNMKYEVGKTFEVPLPITICRSGLHFCLKASDCFSYYDFDPKNIVCEVEALGETQTHDEDSKVCTNKLHIIRIIEWSEVLFLANEGKDNTGHSNSGNWNSGDSNSGNSNSGNRNSGDRNSGNWNSGDSNSGDSNSGNWNSGNWNSGNSNSGNRNSGNWNSGNWNSGDSNSGDRNSGNRNSGNWNSGNWNSGDRNSGDSNSGYRNSGAFCTESNPKLILFDKLTDINVRDWENHEACQIMSNLDFTIWVPSSLMSAEEKEKNPKHETTEGYLKTIPIKEAWANLWGNLTDKKKSVFTSLPGFDSDKFFEITGIRA
jgi:hypothetical protein